MYTYLKPDNNILQFYTIASTHQPTTQNVLENNEDLHVCAICQICHRGKIHHYFYNFLLQPGCNFFWFDFAIIIRR